MPKITRRLLAAGAGLAAGALALPSFGQQQLVVPGTSRFRAMPLTFNPEKIKWLSPSAILNQHKAYTKAVERLKAIDDEIASLDLANAPVDKVGALKREEHDVYNEVVFKQLYLECLGEAPTRPSGVFAQAIERDFGSFDRWKGEFAAIGKSMKDGGGLAVMTYAPQDKRLVNHAVANYGMGPAACVPLMALDLNERTYGPDFPNDIDKFVDTFVEMARWITPERLYREAIRV
ncbi:MAG: Fe-Mn family superoxide dismutase [Pseudomonadota bacterium]